METKCMKPDKDRKDKQHGNNGNMCINDDKPFNRQQNRKNSGKCIKQTSGYR